MDFIIHSCVSAFQLLLEQTRIDVCTEYEQKIEHLEQEYSQFQEMVKSKLAATHNAYKRFKGKCGELANEQAKLIRDRNELQEKYAQKTAQARRLQEICDNLERENRKLKKLRGAPFFDARPQVSEDSAGAMQGQAQNFAVMPAKRKHIQSRNPHQEGVARTRYSSDVSSLQTPQVQSFGYPPTKGFKATKHRMVEVTNAPTHSAWKQQWTVMERPTFFNSGAQNARINLDPFAINSINPINNLQ